MNKPPKKSGIKASEPKREKPPNAVLHSIENKVYMSWNQRWNRDLSGSPTEVQLHRCLYDDIVGQLEVVACAMRAQDPRDVLQAEAIALNKMRGDIEEVAKRAHIDLRPAARV